MADGAPRSAGRGALKMFFSRESVSVQGLGIVARLRKMEGPSESRSSRSTPSSLPVMAFVLFQQFMRFMVWIKSAVLFTILPDRFLLLSMVLAFPPCKIVTHVYPIILIMIAACYVNSDPVIGSMWIMCRSAIYQKFFSRSINSSWLHFAFHPLYRCLLTWPEMEYSSLQRQLVVMKKSFFDQGFLDEQFYQLEELQDDASPNFVEEVVTLFFRDSSRLVSNVGQALEKYPQDFSRLDSLMHQVKTSAYSIGAAKMKKECAVFREFCDKKNLDGCLRSFQKVKKEQENLKLKLENYFQLLRQLGPAEKATRSGS